jgi:hypothetical protein
MGRILPFAPRFLPESPTGTEALDPAGSVFLLGLRWWVADMKQGHDPLVRLRQTMDIAGAPDAAYSVDYLMGVVLRTARRPIQIGCPRCPRLSRDERRLIHAASLAQAGETSQAEGALRAGMLSPSGAEFALGPLEGLGELMANAGLVFRRHAPPNEREPHSSEIEVWMPPVPTLLH